MGISGYLETFPLPEVFRVLERGQKTGRLTIQIAAPNHPPQFHYIWLSHGRIVAIVDRADHQELLSMLIQRRWLTDNIVAHLNQLQTLETPLCIYLKSQGVLQPEQIKLLFNAQVLQRTCALFKLPNGQFKFDTQATLPKIEMTGLSLSASEAILLGLQVLKDWTFLEKDFPCPTVALAKSTSNKSSLQLDALEKKLWELADGKTPLSTIAKNLSHSIELVQQVAFRLIAVDLLEEVIIEALPSPDRLMENSQNLPESVTASSEKEVITPSFLQNLMSFLRSKV